MSEVAPGSVPEVFDEAFGFVEMLQDSAGNLNIGALAVCPKAVNAVRESAFEDLDQTTCRVINMNPVTDLFSQAVDGGRLVPKSKMDQDRDQFFAMLSGAVVVRAFCNHNFLIKGCVSRLCDEILTRFARRIGGGRF